ncbi:MAG TPA: flagellar protein FlaG [Candidatus Baltobacteraceae bacterium]
MAKIFAGGGIPKPVAVNVSYRVEHDPNIIVTVFTDPTTGQEIAQIPPEVMVQIAQFFDKQSGVTLDRSA